MKQETAETTLQSSTQERNSKPSIIYSIDYFYDKFIKRGPSFYKKSFATDKNIKLKGKRKVTFKEYKKIISTYLNIYFFELYFNKNIMYFFLGGYMRIIIYEDWVNYQPRSYNKKKILIKTDRPFGLFWFNRPSKKSYYHTRIKKLTGKRNAIPKIERLFKKNSNRDLLPIFTIELNKHIKNKTLYRCSLK